MALEDHSIHAWIIKNQLKNEKGDPLTFSDHPFLFDIYRDFSPLQVGMKAAQVGYSTLANIKPFFLMEKRKMDVIYCVDLETEALTKRGFVSGRDITEDDEIMTLGLDGIARWHKVQEIFRKKVTTTMYRYKARNFDAVATEDHRWIVQDARGKMSFVESKDLHKKTLFIPKRIPNNPRKKKRFTDNHIRLLAWIFAEGYFCKQKGKRDFSIVISQSSVVNAAKCEEIREAFRSEGISWKEYRSKEGVINFRFAFEAGRRIKESFPGNLPTADFAISLTREQCRIFIETFVKGDGWTDSSKTMAIAQKNKKCVDILMMIASLGGYAPSLLLPGKNGAYTVRLTQFDFVFTSELKPKIAEETIEVWCPRTPYGTFYARRGGRCYWTGNTLPTANDVRMFVSSKTNRIIGANPVMAELTKDKDTIDQKYVGQGVIHYRGTFTESSAMMIPADLLIHDEVDASKLDIIADYESRLKHSAMKWRWYFSHPSTEGAGVHTHWMNSDQKHWFITCPKCKTDQFISWPESFCMERKVYICRKSDCGAVIDDQTRREGRWVKKYKDRPFSGYWIPSMICPYTPASEIIQAYEEHDIEYFTTKVLGLPYVGAGNKLTWEIFKNNIVQGIPHSTERLVLGVDTGVKIHAVLGGREGIYHYSEESDYSYVEKILDQYPNAVCVIDQGGDLIAPRKLREKYMGRVFLCHFRRDRKTMQLISWGEGDEYGNVVCDRNRMIQLLVDEFTDQRIPVLGTVDEWKPYWEHWGAMYRVREEDTLGVLRSEWKRSGADHFALASVYWRVGMTKFSGDEGAVLGKKFEPKVAMGISPSPEGRVPAKNVLQLPSPDNDKLF
jgi:hypothetical protein